MLELAIPGFKKISLANVVFDLNGTLAKDGLIAPSVVERLKKLQEKLEVLIATAGTHGHLKEVKGLGFQVQLLQKGKEAEQKLKLLEELGASKTAAVGNGANDYLMIERAAFSVTVLGREGAYPPLLKVSHLVVNTPEDAIELFLKPKRIIASLRR
jgi:soluble P-type ATPase